MAHRNWHGITLKVHSTAQFLGLGRGLECACIITAGGVHIAVAGMKPLKILGNHFHQLRGYSVLTVVHCFLLDPFVWVVGFPVEVRSPVLTAVVIGHPSAIAATGSMP